MQILIAGPTAARPFLEALGKAISRPDLEVELHFDLKRLTDYPAWADVDVVVAYSIPCSDDDMAAAPNLRAIIVPSLGYEGIDVASARRRSIAVANGRAQENFETVAEAAILFILMTLYDIHASETRLRSGLQRSGPPAARMLKGKVVGLIGYGNIAQSITARLRGWGVTVLVTGRRPLVFDDPAIEQCDLATLLEQSDIVLPLVPLAPETRHLLSKAEFLRMKQGAILVNLSRGQVIDEHALHDPEVSAHLGGIALDVFEVEPLPLDSPLLARANTILTGHEIAHTQENLRALFETAVTNIEHALAGSELPTALYVT